ncbi:MAG TPA: hypothetical protein PK876_04010 [Elusimicrobiota bacterium]|nr:hypothetical protein [Elusimicrobiota bacterium]
MTEPLIQNKIHLLMEETGCEQGEAELALVSAGYDLQRAIRTIGTLLRSIAVVKGKLFLPSKNLYGLLILIADTRHQSLYRVRAVVSYNPVLYETELNGDWYDFERHIYASRLWEGTLQTVTQELERFILGHLQEGEESIYQILNGGDEDKLKRRFEPLLKSYFKDDAVHVQLYREELNLDQFRRLKRKGEEAELVKETDSLVKGGTESLTLQVAVQETADGIPSESVMAGDSIYVLLTDERDIAQYLSKLLGGRTSTGPKPLLSPVEEVRKEGERILFQFRLGAGITGMARVEAKKMLRGERKSNPSWWKRLFSWSS